MRMLRLCLPLLAMYAAGPVCAAAAADFDGSRPLICASQHVVDLASPEKVVAGLPDKLGAPAFMRIDFDRKVIVGIKRTTPIRVIEREENRILLQGTELGLGWTLAIDREDGEMKGSLVDPGGAIVLFGACMPV